MARKPQPKPQGDETAPAPQTPEAPARSSEPKRQEHEGGIVSLDY